MSGKRLPPGARDLLLERLSAGERPPALAAVQSHSSEKTSPWLRAARAEKVARLVNAIDRVAVDMGIDPIRGALLVAQVVLDELEESGWAELARAAGCNAPSADTIKAVRQVYVQRDEQSADDHFDMLRGRLEDAS